MPPTDSPNFFLRPGRTVTRFTFFISSGADVRQQRDLFEQLVRATSEQFRLRPDPGREFLLDVDRWEQDAPRRTTAMNAEFVRRALESHATVVLLADEIRKGTKEEIEAILADSRSQLSVIWMQNPDSTRKQRALKAYLREKEDQIAYHLTGPAGSPDAMVAMVRVIAASLADITRSDRREELFSEQR
ncbi:hypothetical protein [Microbacterium sp.]|uniref:hypothetical protein n=1 Tax=Microbacterium sp. TaxID=51671 RepID=UPI002810A26C|nr:hypothetical protein [Microbacterium sp.]